MPPHKINAKRILKDESGQSVILIATVIISFIMFFGFAVNTGLLVNAKISVQSAADAAAYAGAATQARQLNAIAFLNYDMRRQYKKFLYRYAVVGNMGNPKFPQAVNPPKPGYYDFGKTYFPNGANGGAQILPINVPSICIPITSQAQNDNCLTVNLPNTASQIPNQGGMSQITQVLYQNIQTIQGIQNDLCKGNSALNFFTLVQWLFKAEYGNSNVEQIFNSMGSGPSSKIKPDDLTKALATISALTNGLGLIPRNILNLLRINTLTAFLNEPPSAETTRDLVEGWEKSPGADQHERTIQAFKSAMANLNESVMDPSTLVMQELQASNQISLTPISVGFNAYVHYMRPDTQPSGNTICDVSILPFETYGVPVGVRRADPNGVVHYAVKLKTKARLLFLPVKDGLELEAVAAAKPFGSRIGPARAVEGDFVEDLKPGTLPTGAINDCTGPLGCRVPNIKIVGGGGATFYAQAYLETLKGVVVQNPQNVSTADILEGQRAATAPNPSEVGLYNILPPPRETSKMAYEFIPYSDDRNKDIYRFYAPVTLASQNDASQRINAIVEQNFPQQIGSNNVWGVDYGALKNQIKAGVANYVNNHLAGATQSEFNESLTFAAIELPMAGVKPAPQGKRYWVAEEDTVRTSWAPAYARIDGGNLGFKPRFGYSVKFVTLQNLLKVGMPANDDDLTKVSH